MRFSEVFLRIGSSLAGWMIVYAYFIWLAVVRRAGCGADGDEIFRLLLGMAPIAAGASFLLRSTRPFPDIHRLLRWFGMPLLAMLLLTVPVMWNVFANVNLAGNSICADSQVSGWQQIWAPVQMIATAICIWMFVTVWREKPER